MPWKGFVGCVSTQTHKQYSVHASGKTSPPHTGAKTHMHTNMDTRKGSHARSYTVSTDKHKSAVQLFSYTF